MKQCLRPWIAISETGAEEQEISDNKKEHSTEAMPVEIEHPPELEAQIPSFGQQALEMAKKEEQSEEQSQSKEELFKTSAKITTNYAKQ